MIHNFNILAVVSTVIDGIGFRQFITVLFVVRVERSDLQDGLNEAIII